MHIIAFKVLEVVIETGVTVNNDDRLASESHRSELLNDGRCVGGNGLRQCEIGSKVAIFIIRHEDIVKFAVVAVFADAVHASESVLELRNDCRVVDGVRQDDLIAVREGLSGQ